MIQNDGECGTRTRIVARTSLASTCPPASFVYRLLLLSLLLPSTFPPSPPPTGFPNLAPKSPSCCPLSLHESVRHMLFPLVYLLDLLLHSFIDTSAPHTAPSQPFPRSGISQARVATRTIPGWICAAREGSSWSAMLAGWGPPCTHGAGVNLGRSFASA
jgi:hypothetical protein